MSDCRVFRKNRTLIGLKVEFNYDTGVLHVGKNRTLIGLKGGSHTEDVCTVLVKIEP